MSTDASVVGSTGLQSAATGFKTASQVLLGDRRGAEAVYWLAVVGLCVVQGLLAWRLAGEINPDTGAFDQGAYLLMVERMEGSPYPWYSDGTRNPLVPWLAAVMLDANSPGIFLHAKRLNVVLGIVGTVALAIFFRRRFGPLVAWNATALSSLALLLPSSTFFGAETLFFPLFFFAFYTALRLLDANPPGLSVLCGVLAGLAALAKASVSPLLALYFGWGALQTVGSGRSPRWFAAREGWSARNFLLGGCLLLACYFGLQAPRMVHAQQTWGSPFYSLPSFWFWADDWEQCVTRYTDCRAGVLEKMPPAERPTLQGYFLRNTPADAVARLTNGLVERTRQFFHPEGKFELPFDKRGKPKRVVLPHRGFYLLGLWGCVLAISGVAFWETRKRRAPWAIFAGLGPFGLPALFFLSTCALYFTAMAWYLPTGPGHRFILTLFLPVLWASLAAGEALRRAVRSPGTDIVMLATHLVIAGFLLARISFLVVDGTFKKIDYTF